MNLHLDFESRSRLDLPTVGLDRYARDCSILMLGWAVDEEEPAIWFPHEPVPWRLAEMIQRKDVVKCAFNSAFERAIFWHCLRIEIPVQQWLDAQVSALYAGIHSKLEVVSDFLQLGDKGKHKEGKALINFFCKPRTAGKKKGEFNDPADHPEKWQRFIDYCKADVVAEREILHRLEKFFTPPEKERRLWELDAKMNRRGIPVSSTFVRSAQTIVNAERERLLSEMKAVTGIDNPNSNPQLLAWLKTQGYPLNSLGKAKVTAALEEVTV